jgi:hypothetical protein
LPRERRPRPILRYVERRILAQDRLLEPPELFARLQAELLRELTPSAAVRVERLGLPRRTVEGEHQLAVQVLPERMLGHERLQLADELLVAAAGQVGLDPLLERYPTQLLEPGNLSLDERFVRQVGQRWPAPERQRSAQLPCRVMGIRIPGLAQQPLEAPEIEFRAVDLQHVAGCPGDQPTLSELLPEFRHVHLDALRSRQRRRPTP